MPRIGTAEVGGTFHTQAAAIAELHNRGRSEEDRCAVEASDASIDNANRLDRGDLEFGFMASNWIGRARDGVAPFRRPIELRMVSPVNAGPIFFVTLARSPIRTVNDFAGRRIALGLEQSGMVQHARAMLGLLDLSFERFSPVYLGYDQAAEALLAGEVDALFLPPIPNRIMTGLSERADIRIVKYAPGQLERILAEVPYYRSAVIECDAFRGGAESSSQVAVVNVLVTHERVAEAAVRDLARTIIDNLDRLPEMNPLFRGIRELFVPLRALGAAAFEFGGVPLHPGALRALRETGWLR